MGSNASSSTATNEENVAVDASLANGEGVQILDSVIVDPSDAVMIEMVQGFQATFADMMDENTIGLDRMLDLASEVMDVVDNGQATMTGFAYAKLKSARDFLEASKEQGQFVIELARDTQAQSFSLAGDVVNGYDGLTNRALDLVADTKAADPTEMLSIISFTLVVFGLGAIFLATKD